MDRITSWRQPDRTKRLTPGSPIKRQPPTRFRDTRSDHDAGLLLAGSEGESSWPIHLGVTSPGRTSREAPVRAEPHLSLTLPGASPLTLPYQK
jgi:hypothetical protein